VHKRPNRGESATKAMDVDGAPRRNSTRNGIGSIEMTIGVAPSVS